MRIRTFLWTPLCLLFALTVTFGGGSATGADRYVGELVNGTAITGGEIHDWCQPQQQPRLDGRQLLAENEPVRWLQDSTQSVPTQPPAFVELAGGDQLPGRVILYRDGTALSESMPPFVEVAPAIGVDLANAARAGGVPVFVSAIRRIVWQRRDDARPRPSTAFLRDGREIVFRGLRWQESSVRLLVESETRDVPFADLAELHLPERNPWEQYFDQLAALAPRPDARLIQIETSDGLRLTTTLERLRSVTEGDPKHRKDWRHGVQPAWTSEPLWLRFPTIRTWRFFQTREVPLTAISPGSVVYRSTFSGGFPPQVDRSVHGSSLATAEYAAGWGYGVHAYSELSFPLIPAVKSFTTKLGLDRSVGDGGCLKCEIRTGNAPGQAVFTTPILRGSAAAIDSGPIALEVSPDSKQMLTLVVDPVLKDRPAGADPFEIRDSLDWINPLLTLDAALLQNELNQRGPLAIPGWTGWSLVGTTGTPPEFVTLWQEAAGRRPRFRTIVRPTGTFTTWSKRLTPRPEERYLVIAASRLEKESAPNQIQVRVAGHCIADWETPIRYPWADTDPLFVRLPEVDSGPVTVEITQIGNDPKAFVDWRGVTLIGNPVTTHTLYEDDAGFITEMNLGEAKWTSQAANVHSGQAALELEPGARMSPQLGPLSLPIREHPQLGEYRFLRFAAKAPTTASLMFSLAHDGRWGEAITPVPRESFRYLVGNPRPDSSAVPIGKPTDKWEVYVRDLYADFGNFSLTGLGVETDGNAWLDGIVLARRPEDFQNLFAKPAEQFGQLPADLKAKSVLDVTSRLDFPRVVDALAPGFGTPTQPWDGIWLLSEALGRNRVLRSITQDAEHPFVIRAPFEFAADTKPVLHLTVGHEPDRSWTVRVTANGQEIHSSSVHKETTTDGWRDIEIDLSPLAGQSVLLQIEQRELNGRHFGYWQKVDVKK